MTPRDYNPWGARLQALKAADPTVSVGEAIEDAGDWDACPVGIELGLRADEFPSDVNLKALGAEFHAAVQRTAWSEAIALYEQLRELIRNDKVDLRPNTQ